MKVDFNEDGSADVSFPFDQSKVRLCRCLGGDYDGKSRSWSIVEPSMVSLLRQCEQFSRKNGKPLDEVLSGIVQAKIDRSQTQGDTMMHVEIPPGAMLTGAQTGAVRWMTKHDSVLQADPMGAGKTIMCAVTANHLKCKSVLIIVIASVKANWRAEWRKWNMMARRGETTVACANGSFWPDTDVVILNFDILERFRTRYKFNQDGDRVIAQNGQIDAREWDMIVIDECHKIKGIKALRTQAVIGEYRRGRCLMEPLRARYKIAMSGTPIVNRPIEAFPAAHWLWPASFPSHHKFGMRYCDAKRGSHGWDYKGNSNEYELNARLRLLGMISRPKTITHADIPPKTRRIVEFDVPGMSRLIESEKSEFAGAVDTSELRAKAESALVLNDEATWRSAMKELKTRVDIGVGKLTEARMRVARALLPSFIEYIKGCIEERGKVVVFGWHQEVIEAIHRAFPGSGMIHGGVQTDDRKPIMDRFQNDPECKLIVGSIGAMGTGVTLTASDLILFVELHWVPGDISQAEDRCHRYGQDKHLEVRYLVAEGSISAVMAERIIEKIEVIERCTGPIQKALANIPISTSTEEEMPVSATPYPDLEALGRHGIENMGTRDRLVRVARGLVKGRLHKQDQLVAGLLTNMATWNPVQRALAEKMVERYGE